MYKYTCSIAWHTDRSQPSGKLEDVVGTVDVDEERRRQEVPRAPQHQQVAQHRAREAEDDPVDIDGNAVVMLDSRAVHGLSFL